MTGSTMGLVGDCTPTPDPPVTPLLLFNSKHPDHAEQRSKASADRAIICPNSFINVSLPAICNVHWGPYSTDPNKSRRHDTKTAHEHQTKYA
jgi:hypothetical protein